MASVMKRLCLASFLVAALVTAAMPAGAIARDNGNKHSPPYKKGPSGGDEWNYIHADPETGEMMLLRLFPGFPPVVGCFPEPAAAWAMFHVEHKVTAPVKKVTANYEGLTEPYAWITVGVRNKRGAWLGVKKFQGPHAGSGKVTTFLHHRAQRGQPITIEFGLQLGDACPQVSGAAVSFTSVKVN